MKLWVDDVREPPGPDWVWALSLIGAMNIIEAAHEEVTQISLDHDLGQDSDERAVNTMPIAKWYEAEAESGRLKEMPIWSVHSMNPDGRRALIAAMQRAQKFIDDRHIDEELRRVMI